MGKYVVKIDLNDNYKAGLDRYIDENGNLHNGWTADENSEFSVSDKISEDELKEEILKGAYRVACAEIPVNVPSRVYAYVYNKCGDLLKVYKISNILDYPSRFNTVINRYTSEEFYREQGLSDDTIREGTKKECILSVRKASDVENEIAVCIVASLVAFFGLLDTKTMFEGYIEWFYILLGGIASAFGISLKVLLDSIKMKSYFKNKLLKGLEQDPENLELMKKNFMKYIDQEHDKMYGITKKKDF